MTDIKIIHEDVERVTFATGVWFLQYACEYTKVGMKRNKCCHANAMRYDQCTDRDKNLAVLAFNVQIMQGHHKSFSDISEVTREFKDTHLWLVDFPGIPYPPRILVTDNHQFINRKLKYAVKQYLDEIRNGYRDWWSGKSV